MDIITAKNNKNDTARTTKEAIVLHQFLTPLHLVETHPYNTNNSRGRQKLTRQMKSVQKSTAKVENTIFLTSNNIIN